MCAVSDNDVRLNDLIGRVARWQLSHSTKPSYGPQSDTANVAATRPVEEIDVNRVPFLVDLEAREREAELQNQMAQEARDRIEELRELEREARRAAVRWRFAPRTEGGLAVARENLDLLGQRAICGLSHVQCPFLSG